MAKKKIPLTVADERSQEIIKKYEEFIQQSTVVTEIHQAYREDKKFVELGLQWEAAALAQRNSEIIPRPSLVVNLCAQFSLLVANDAAKQNIGGKVVPVGFGASEKTAEVYEGLLRAIQRDAQPAYDHALKDAVNGGFGVFRVIPEYESDDSFDQCLKIRRVMDATSVRWDDCSEPDFSDALRMTFAEQMDRQAFIAEFGKDALQFYEGNSGPTAPSKDAWGDKDGPVVVEFWYVEQEKEQLYQLIDVDENGIHKTAWASELESKGGDVPDSSIMLDDEGEPVSRKSARRKVKWCKLAGGKVLKEVDWLGYWIPIFIVPGREVEVDGLHKFVSMIRPMKDSQRFYNYVRSSQLERISLAPKNPWYAPEDSISAQNKRFWNTANTQNHSILKYKQYDDQGRQLNKPERAQSIQSDTGLTTESQITSQELKQVTGQYDPSLGKSQGDQSGKAIIALQDQGNTSTYDFIQHRNTAITHCMRVLMDLIPYYYDTPRQVMIVAPDGNEKIVTINAPKTDAQGVPYHHDLTTGKYTVAVEIGVDRKTRLLQAADGFSSLIQAIPQAAAARPDLMFKLGAESQGLDPILVKEVVDSMKVMLPPEVQAQVEQEGKAQPIPPKVLQALQQADQEHQQSQQMIQELVAKVGELTETKIQEQRKIEVDEYKAETERMKVMLDHGASIEQAMISANVEMEKEHIKAATAHAGNLAQPPKTPSQEGATQPEMAATTGDTAALEVAQ